MKHINESKLSILKTFENWEISDDLRSNFRDYEEVDDDEDYDALVSKAEDLAAVLADRHPNASEEEVRKAAFEWIGVDDEEWKKSQILRDANDTTGLLEKKILKEPADIIEKIKRLHNLPKELKDEACKLVKEYSRAERGRVYELQLHPDLIKKCQEQDLPTGFSMGIDKNGYYVHTHRARCKSYKSPDAIPAKDIKFIDSTG